MKMIIILLIICWLMMAKVRIFHEMEENEWKALIPLYSDYILARNTWHSESIIFHAALLLCTCLSLSIASEMILCSDPELTMTGIILIVIVVLLVDAILTSKELYKLSQSTHSGSVQTIGFMFTQPIVHVVNYLK